MNWLIYYVPLPFLIASLVGCQEQRAMRREALRELRQLSRDDQRSVAWAVRRGEAVEQPRLVAPALAWARSTAVRCRWDTLFSVVWLGVFLLDASLAMSAREWKRAAVLLVEFDLFALLGAVGQQFKRRARESELATTLRRFEAATAASRRHG